MQIVTLVGWAVVLRYVTIVVVTLGVLAIAVGVIKWCTRKPHPADCPLCGQPVCHSHDALVNKDIYYCPNCGWCRER